MLYRIKLSRHQTQFEHCSPAKMSRIPHILARISPRSPPRASLLRPRFHLAFSTTSSTSASLQEHNLSSPTRPQPTSPGGAPTPSTHPSYFPRGPPPESDSSGGGSSKNFYRTHGRALFKALTLAFLAYQVCYWGWLTLETEEIKRGVESEMANLEGEVRRLQEGREGRRILEEGEGGR